MDTLTSGREASHMGGGLRLTLPSLPCDRMSVPGVPQVLGGLGSGGVGSPASESLLPPPPHLNSVDQVVRLWLRPSSPHPASQCFSRARLGGLGQNE